MKKVVIAFLLAIFAATAANAGYYRNKNQFGGYDSTDKTNDMGGRRAPDGYHTDEDGHVRSNGVGW